MRVDVMMPQMGESIAEGTLTRWLKKVGDSVERDEPIFEISTDKVDAEIPSPVAGVLKETKCEEGDVVEVNAVVAIIETDGSAAEEAPAKEAPAAAAPPAPEPAAAAPTPAPTPAPAPPPKSSTDAEGKFISPVVRKIAASHDIDPTQVRGTGAGGRVTKNDILAFIDAGGATGSAAASTIPAPAYAALPGSTAAPVIPPAATTSQSDAPAFDPGKPTSRVKMTQMRKIIAEHMLESRRASAHVHSVFEIDVSGVAGLRAKYKQTYLERHGTKLTFMPFFINAICGALRAWPIVNSSIEGDEVVYRKELNIGLAVALDWGLIVPVIRNADELSLAGLSKRVNDLAERSRTKKLNPDDVQGGTFTLTNPGSFGGLFGLPIINQPQVAILGIGGIKKRPVVINDAIAIRSMVYVAMSYDHRVVDGAVADQFLARVKQTLENFDESLL